METRAAADEDRALYCRGCPPGKKACLAEGPETCHCNKAGKGMRRMLDAETRGAKRTVAGFKIYGECEAKA